MNEWITTFLRCLSRGTVSFWALSLLTVKLSKRQRGKHATCIDHIIHTAHIISTSFHIQPVKLLCKKWHGRPPCLSSVEMLIPPGLYGHGSEAKTFCTPQLKMKLRSPYREKNWIWTFYQRLSHSHVLFNWLSRCIGHLVVGIRRFLNLTA